MATASESQPLFSTNSAAWAGSVRQTLPIDVFLDAAELAQFGLDHDPLGMGPIDDPPGGLDVLLELLVRGVDHHRAIEAALDAVVADLFGAVVEVDGEDHLGKDLRRPCGSSPPGTACRYSRGRRGKSAG